jgi:hypothetical protein
MDDYTKSLAVMTWMTLIAAIWMFFTVEARSIQLPVSKNSTAERCANLFARCLC